MTPGTTEFSDMIESFEKSLKQTSISGRMDKESRAMWKVGHFYQDGNINTAFLVFRWGYAAGKTAERLEMYTDGGTSE